LDWRLGPGKVGHKNAKTLPLVKPPKRTPNPKLKNFFSVEARRRAESVGGLNTSLGLAAGELWIVMELKNLVKLVAAVGLKGLDII